MEALMIGVLTHHWAKPDKVDEAKRLLDRNGAAQGKAPGFVSRQTLYSVSDATKITTLVVWDSNDIYDQWRASPERAAAMSGADALWSKAPESERFEVVTADGTR
jgi:heme-degrading monooxygenase HmoA